VPPLFLERTDAMNGLDYTILIGAGLFFVLGLYWGLIRQVLSIIGLVVGVAAAGRFGPEVGAWLSSFVADPVLAGAIGFLGVLLLVSALASLAASVLRLFVGLLFLGWLDHLLGGVLGLVQAGLAAAVLVLAMVIFPLESWSDAVATSVLAQPLLQVGGIFGAVLPDYFQAAILAALGR
jgi:membrane protein required for colicin V production